jgi:hypothetical protein
MSISKKVKNQFLLKEQIVLTQEGFMIPVGLLFIIVYNNVIGIREKYGPLGSAPGKLLVAWFELPAQL